MKKIEQIQEEVRTEISQSICQHKSFIKSIKLIWDRQKNEFIEDNEFQFNCFDCNAVFLQLPFDGFDLTDKDIAEKFVQ